MTKLVCNVSSRWASDAPRRKEILVELPDAVQASALVVHLLGQFNASLEETAGRWRVKITIGSPESDRVLRHLIPHLKDWLETTSLNELIVRNGDAHVVVERPHKHARAAFARQEQRKGGIQHSAASAFGAPSRRGSRRSRHAAFAYGTELRRPGGTGSISERCSGGGIGVDLAVEHLDLSAGSARHLPLLSWCGRRSSWRPSLVG